MAELEDIIWEEFDELLYKSGGNPSQLHLPKNKVKDPYCQEMLNEQFKMVVKPIDAYPKGYREICGNCRKEWEEDR